QLDDRRAFLGHDLQAAAHSPSSVQWSWKVSIGNEEHAPFIPFFFKSNLRHAMKASTPRLTRLPLLLVEHTLRLTPLPRLLTKLVIDRKLAAIDFAVEGHPAPFYMPAPYRRP